MSRVYCLCLASAMSVTGAPTDGSALAHAVSAIGTVAASAKASIPDPVGVIHDEVVGTSRTP